MSQISIIIPLDVLKGAESLTAEGISEFLRHAIESSNRAATAEKRVEGMVGVIRTWGTELAAILDSDSDTFMKFQALRTLSDDTRIYGGGV